MRKSYLLVILLLGLIITRCADSGPKVVEKPAYGLQNFQTVEVSKVVLTDTATILYMDAYFPEGNWITIDSATYIRAGGKKHILKSAEGIVIHQQHWMPKSGEDHFTLTFPPIPKGTKTIDFIESDCDRCFKIWDIDLTGKAGDYKAQLPDDILNYKLDSNYELPEPQFKTGKTKVTLYITGWKEGYDLNNTTLYVNNIFTGEQEMVEGKKESDGKYVFEAEMYSTSCAYIRFGESYANMILNPGEDAEIYYDLTASSRKHSRYNPQPGLVYGGFKGDFAQINTQLLQYRDAMSAYETNYFSDTTVLDMTGQQLADYLFNNYDEKTAELDKSDLPKAMKELTKLTLKTSLVYDITVMNKIFEVNYREKNKLDWDSPVNEKFPKATVKDFQNLKKINPNDPMWIYSNNFAFIARGLVYSLPSDQMLNEITGTESGLLQDLKKSYIPMRKATAQEKLTAEEEKNLASTSTPYYTEVYNYILAKSKREYEEAIAKGGFVIKPTPEISGDKLLESIVAQYKGQAVFVDFWATWCGPCLQAMKTIKPIKPEMKEKGVVSLYISNESSSKPQWTTMLPEIGGLHYYLTEKQWSALSAKYNIQGIPTYMIFDKNGKKVFECAGYPGNDKIREELAKVW